MMRQARRSSAIQHYTVRCGFLSQRSYVAPSRQRRSSSKRPRKELTYCPIYGFKSFLICAKELTPALFGDIKNPAEGRGCLAMERSVDRVLERLARLEARNLRSSNLDRIPGLRIATLARSALLYQK